MKVELELSYEMEKQKLFFPDVLGVIWLGKSYSGIINFRISYPGISYSIIYMKKFIPSL